MADEIPKTVWVPALQRKAAILDMYENGEIEAVVTIDGVESYLFLAPSEYTLSPTSNQTYPKTDWKVGDTCYIDGVRHKVTDLINTRMNGLPDCIVERSAWFEDMKETE